MANSKKIISFILLLALVLTSAACSGNSDKKDIPATLDTTAISNTTAIEGDYEPLVLPEGLDFGGEKVRILVEAVNDIYLESGQFNMYSGELTVEDLISEPVNDAVYNRELYVEELLNVDIERVMISENGAFDMQNYLINNVMAGNDPGEIAAVTAQAAIWQTDDNLFQDLAGNEYINIDAPWWFDEYTTATSIGDHYFAITGDLSLSLKRCLYVTFFNKNMAKNENIEDIYQVVFDGKWTIDYLTEVTSGIYRDLNGNSAADIEDYYGLIISETSIDPFWTAFEIDIFKKDSNNYVDYVLDHEKFGIAVDKMNALYAAKSTNDVGWPEDDIFKYFAQDMGLFAVTRMFKVETETMRNMQSEYGILPLPKYDEEQEGYYTMPSDRYTAFALPSTSTKGDMASAVLEAMAWYSYRYVTPAYFDIAVKGKYANDQETRNMLDMIFAGYHVDTGWVAADKLYAFPQMWRDIVSGEYSSWSSELAKKEKKISILVKQYNEYFDKYD